LDLETKQPGVHVLVTQCFCFNLGVSHTKN
jgi:hypothetical protein